MNGFDAARAVEDEVMHRLWPFLESRADGASVVRIAKGPLAKWLQEEIGDVVYNRDGEFRAIEIKGERVLRQPDMTLFLETWSNRNLADRGSHAERGSNPGWLYKLRATALLYYFLDCDLLVALDVFKLKQWAFVKGRLWDFPEKGQAKYQQRNDTWGRCVPLRVLVDEAGAQCCRVRQLSMQLGERAGAG